MKNKYKIGVSIVIMIVVIILKATIAIDGTTQDYNSRFSIGRISSNASSEQYSQTRIFSDVISANLTSENQLGGRLSILKYNLPPIQPSLNIPNNTFITNSEINLSWSNTTDPNQLIDFDSISYILEIFNDTSLTEIYYRNESISETANTTKDTITLPESDITLYWQVIATDNDLNSTPSELRIMGKDIVLPTSFDLTSPSNDTTTTDNTPSLNWEATNETNLDNYTIEFSTSSIYNDPNYTQYSTTNSFSNWTTELAADTYFWKVIAYDKAGNSNESNQFRLVVSAITQTITQTVSAGESITRSGGVSKKPFNLDIIAPPTITIYSQDSVIVPLIVTNPANEIILRGINLNVSSESEDIAPALGSTFIPELRPKEQRQIPLTIVTHTEPGTYGITITASVINPEFTDSVKILANLIESDKESSKIQSEKQIIFAQELFKGNPGCKELEEYITQAQKEIENERYDKALNLANNAIQACKDLIALKGEPSSKSIETYLDRFKLNQTVLILVGEAAAFLLTVLLLLKLFKKKK